MDKKTNVPGQQFQLIRQSVSLNGVWRFALDPTGVGEQDKWYNNLLEAEINLPGSWEEQGYGEPCSNFALGEWNKLRQYTGQAWYVLRVEMASEWAGQRVDLVLSGVRWSSRVWLDGHFIGEETSLSTKHTHVLTPFIQLGKTQQIAILVDNRMLLPIEESHIHSNQTATRWGGITGGAELRISPSTAIGSVKIWPKPAAQRFDFEINLDGISEPDEALDLEITVTDPQSRTVFSESSPVTSEHVTVSVPLGDQAHLWWDDDPFLYMVDVRLTVGSREVDHVTSRAGLREIRVEGKHILLNGRPTFLRGYVDCCIFPHTGYPVWDIEFYRRQFGIAKQYGFNHVRLHSWNPPEPFWEAADEAGMLVQTELPNWSSYYGIRENEPDPAVHAFLLDEQARIIHSLNHHPSWVMFSNGNELIYGADGHAGLLELVYQGKQLDPTRLYTDNTGFGLLPAPQRTVDFYIQSCSWHPPQRLYDAATPNTTEDFSAVTALADRPLIAHEHGQFTMYVRPQEAAKYTGVIRPSWLAAIQSTLEAKEMTSRVDEYIAASGAHIVRTYKENIERARRTEGLAGIQLLDIRDFPGQGHATTGILDMFWDSKGLVDPRVFAQSNGAQTLLMQAPSRTVRGGTPLLIDLELSNFGADMADTVVQWELLTNSERHASGELTVTMARSGQITPLGQLRLDTPADQAYTWLLRARIGDITNEWNFWSFPEIDASQPHPDVSCNIPSLRGLLLDADFSDDYSGSMLNIDRRRRHPDCHLAISSHLTYPLLQYLSDGGRVWLLLSAENLYDYVPSRYLPPFWSYLHFPDNVSTVMGMIIHAHQALERFPHDGTSDWHWYHLVNDTPALCLDSVPNLSPMIEVIDNFNRAKRLAYMFEASVGKGKLLVSTLRFLQPSVMQQPEARWLFDLLREYVSGDDFVPLQKLSIGELLGLVHLTNQRPTGFVD